MKVLTKSMSWAVLVSLILLSFIYFRMQVSSEISWSALDFILAGFISWSFATCVQLVYHYRHNTKLRYIFLAILLLIVLTYVDLAVGIFGLHWSGS